MVALPSVIPDGVYDIKHSVSKQYLGSTIAQPHDTHPECILEERQSARTKWQVTSIGKGYTVKHMQSGLYCALQEGRTFSQAHVVLSSTPIVWDMSYLDEQMRTVRIFWSITQLCWDADVPAWDEQVCPVLSEIESGQRTSSTWQLLCHRAVTNETNWNPNRIPQGVYALQNLASLTYVSLSRDERTLECWPPGASHLRDTKLWEITPLGAGYTIKLRDTDRYCTLNEGISNGSSVSVSNIPAAWKIKVLESPLQSDGIYIQIFWAETEMAWDLRSGKDTPGNPIYIKKNKDYQECRIFKLIE